MYSSYIVSLNGDSVLTAFAGCYLKLEVLYTFIMNNSSWQTAKNMDLMYVLLHTTSRRVLNNVLHVVPLCAVIVQWLSLLKNVIFKFTFVTGSLAATVFSSFIPAKSANSTVYIYNQNLVLPISSFSSVYISQRLKVFENRSQC